MEKTKEKHSISRVLESLPGEMALVTAEGTLLACKGAGGTKDYRAWPAISLFSDTEKACRLHWLVPGDRDPALTVGLLELLLGELVAAGQGYWFKRLLTEPAASLSGIEMPPEVQNSMPCRLGALKVAELAAEEAQEALRTLLPDMRTYRLGSGFVILKLPAHLELARDWSESIMALLAEELMLDPLMIDGETVSDIGLLRLYASALESICEALYAKGTRGVQPLLAYLPELIAGGLIDDPLTLIRDLGRIIEPVLKDPDLSQTAAAFIQTNLSISETAQNLFLHRNTLVYRLGKIEKLTGLDLKRLDHAMAFVLLKAGRGADR